jgi:predicted GNAT family acetyltransferase
MTEEVIHFEKSMSKAGRKISDQYDYDLMYIDRIPDIKNKRSCPANLVLRTPSLAELDLITPLQAAYEMEEVIPAGSSFNPKASRLSTAKMIAGGKILAAEINGRFIGKIHVNAISFTRYQVGGVYVHPEFRALGIAGRMTAQFITALLGECRGITLFVKKNNVPARRLYTGLGFTGKGDYRITYY